MDQSIRFCSTDDGVRIAYATSGKGSPIVRPGHWLTHLEYDLKSPVFQPLLAGLSEQHTLVRYDLRGTGMSDRDVGDISPELWLKDLEAVVGALGLDRFALLGMSQGGPAAIRYAVKHPEKVTHLILCGSYARGRLHRERWAAMRSVCTRFFLLGHDKHVILDLCSAPSSSFWPNHADH
jgi:pimeloyl-ACP methyl ester carboxylesterase